MAVFIRRLAPADDTKAQVAQQALDQAGLMLHDPQFVARLTPEERAELMEDRRRAEEALGAYRRSREQGSFGQAGALGATTNGNPAAAVAALLVLALAAIIQSNSSSPASRQAGEALDQALRRLQDLVRRVGTRPLPAPPPLPVSAETLRLIAGAGAALAASATVNMTEIAQAVEQVSVALEEEIGRPRGPTRCLEAIQECRRLTTLLLGMLSNPSAHGQITILRNFEAWKTAVNAVLACLGLETIF